MSVRTKLFLIFLSMAVIVVAVCSVFTYFNFISKEKLIKSLKYQQELFEFTTLTSALSELERRIYFYVLLGGEEEKSKVEKILNEMKNIDLKELKSEVDKLFSLKTKDTFKQVEKTISEIKTIEQKVNEEKIQTEKNLKESQETVNKLATISFIVSSVTTISVILITVLVNILTYFFLIKPINQLRLGTEIIGSGNLDYKISIPRRDEFGKLANSFNEMVENIKNLQIQIVAMDRMSSIGQLAGGIAHEINNPLTGVIGQAQILLQKVPKDNPFYDNLIKIERAAQRCRKIVKALLDFAREKYYSFVSSDINSLIDETLELCMSDLLSNKVNVVKQYDKLPQIKVSPSHLQQVFMNLITNAMDAMPSGGELLISTYKQNESIVISFKDTGTGINKENLQKIFSPFFTTKEIGKGVGLGLAVSYGIIKRHNGDITVKSDGEGKGAEFIIKLPIT